MNQVRQGVGDEIDDGDREQTSEPGAAGGRVECERASREGMGEWGMHVFLETDRLLLRRLRMDDLDDLYALNTDPEVMRWLTGGPAIPREVIEREYLPAFLDYYERSPGYGFWAAIEKATGDFLGWFHFRPHRDAPQDEPELGYRLRREAWGKGYGTEGSRALIDKGFRDLGVRRVVASTMTVNTASRRVMEKCGMRLVRTFFMEWPEVIEGSEHGDVEYAITREEWEEQRRLRA